MADLEIEGTLQKKLAVQTGRSARGDWAKQEFLLEIQDGKFPTIAVFSVWGQDKVDGLARFNEGSQVKVSFSISSREYNGKYYTDLRAWRIVAAGSEAVAAPVAPAAPRADRAQSVPAGFQAPAPTLADMPADDPSDDLPF